MDAPPVVLGLDFGGTKTALAVAQTDGTRLGSATRDTGAGLGAAASLAGAIQAARELLDAVAPGRRLAAVGVATIGIPGENGVALAPNIPGWDALALGRELRQAFPGAEIRLATDVKAAARIEAESGALVGCDPAIYLNLGTGLAVAIVANGAVIDGRNGASGEIGYNLRALDDVGRSTAQRIPLEDVVSGKALMLEAASVLAVEEADIGALAAEFFARAEDARYDGADPKPARLVDRFVAELSFHLVNLAIAVDPVRIAVGGGLVRSWAPIRDGLRRALDAAVPYPPELVRAAYPYDAPLLGALTLALAAAGDTEKLSDSTRLAPKTAPAAPGLS
ncbi:MAG TPA: ROK family protein [Actinocrinis sp.]|nr:ROK family protein [Actinocrinis sp.]